MFTIDDFNFHVDDPTNNEASNFLDLINSYNLTRHVSSAMHRLGHHTLDLIIIRSSEEAVTDVFVLNNALPDICNHFPVHFYLPVNMPKLQEKVITYRKYRQINTNIVQKDIQESILYLTSVLPPGEVVQQYNTVVAELLNKHAAAPNRMVAK